jgi:signal transduction histidine kinase
MEEFSKGLKKGYSSIFTRNDNSEELERAYLLLENSYDEIDKLRKVKVEFLAFITHVLRTPLTNLSAFKLLEKSTLSEEQKEIMEIAKHGYQEMEYVINRAIEYFMLISEPPQAKPERVDLLTLIGDSIFEHLEKFKESKIFYFINFDKNIFVDTDIEILYKIINILTDNAIKFNRRHGKVYYSCTETDDKISLNINDTGCGIKPDSFEEIFFPFSVQNMKFHSHGTGLSLPIAKNLAHYVGGELHVQSEGLGCGATFIIDLPKKFPDSSFSEQSI